MNVNDKFFIINHILQSGDYDFNAENFMQNDNNKDFLNWCRAKEAIIELNREETRKPFFFV